MPLPWAALKHCPQDAQGKSYLIFMTNSELSTVNMTASPTFPRIIKHGSAASYYLTKCLGESLSSIACENDLFLSANCEFSGFAEIFCAYGWQKEKKGYAETAKSQKQGLVGLQQIDL